MTGVQTCALPISKVTEDMALACRRDHRMASLRATVEADHHAGAFDATKVVRHQPLALVSEAGPDNGTRTHQDAPSSFVARPLGRLFTAS